MYRIPLPNWRQHIEHMMWLARLFAITLFLLNFKLGIVSLFVITVRNLFRDLLVYQAVSHLSNRNYMISRFRTFTLTVISVRMWSWSIRPFDLCHMKSRCVVYGLTLLSVLFVLNIESLMKDSHVIVVTYAYWSLFCWCLNTLIWLIISHIINYCSHIGYLVRMLQCSVCSACTFTTTVLNLILTEIWWFTQFKFCTGRCRIIDIYR